MAPFDSPESDMLSVMAAPGHQINESAHDDAHVRGAVARIRELVDHSVTILETLRVSSE